MQTDDQCHQDEPLEFRAALEERNAAGSDAQMEGDRVCLFPDGSRNDADGNLSAVDSHEVSIDPRNRTALFNPPTASLKRLHNEAARPCDPSLCNQRLTA
ncbi:hypothetical protein ROHU_028519 [Labeo rohita]|uniref:Uncharacterized protein n=1 Tax=Labeo rohita TaxID=84645 RepID=A0A498M6N9_LABRO|nr:hypothetical protein ROHU_028519 [Labeo rohita]